jgi:hypothetical protein
MASGPRRIMTNMLPMSAFKVGNPVEGVILMKAHDLTRGLGYLAEYRVHARLLVAIPALVVGELFMESRFRAVLTHIRQVGLLDATDLAYMDEVIATLVRARDAYLPEVAVLVLLIVHTATSYRGLVVDPNLWFGQGSGAHLHLTIADWYVILVSALGRSGKQESINENLPPCPRLGSKMAGALRSRPESPAGS